MSSNDVEQPCETRHNCSCSCRCLRFSGVKEAQGCAMLWGVRGTILGSNVYLSASLIYLASVAAGCTEETCSNTIFGMRPSSLITNIAFISGVSTALLMPITGAIIDFTPRRRMIGIASAVLLTTIQWAQIGTVQSTWFYMAILQAIAGFVYEVQVLATYSYLPEIGRVVEDDKMTSYTAMFSITMSVSRAVFLVLVLAISRTLGLNDVRTAQVSQGIVTAVMIVGFIIAWVRLPAVPKLHKLGSGEFLFTAGFVQICRTTRGICKHYGKSLGWFLLGSMFLSAGATAFQAVAVTYMSAFLEMNSDEVGAAFLIGLILSVIGAHFGSIVTKKTNPVNSCKSMLVLFSVITVSAAIVLHGPELKSFCYLFAALWGICLGWYSATTPLIFSLVVPKGQESELTGFYLYSEQIIVWLPPLVFTLMNEYGVSMRWGLASLVIFFIISLIFLQLMAPWSDVRESALANNKIIVYRDENSEPNDDENAENHVCKNTLQ